MQNKTLEGSTLSLGDHHNKYSIPVEVVIVLLILILLFDLVGNTVVVSVIIMKRKMQTFTNWLILNLALADLSVALICIPLEIPIELHNKWLYGKIFCTFFYPSQSATIYASVFTLVVLSCSRYWAIIHPFKSQPTAFVAKLSICVIWLMSFVLVVPYMVALKYNKHEDVCREAWTPYQSRVYTVVTFLIQYLLPLLLISAAYSFIIYEITLKKNPSASLYEDKTKDKENKRMITLLLTITVVFALSVLPYNIVALSYAFGNAESFRYIEDVSLASYILLYLNSALNPIIYNVFSSSFREAFAESYQRVCKCLCKENQKNCRDAKGGSHRRGTSVKYCKESQRLAIRLSNGQ